RQPQQRAHATDRAAAQPGAAAVEDAHRHFEALADRAEYVFRRHSHIDEGDGGGAGCADAHLVLVRAVADARPAGFDQERGDLALGRVGAREHGIEAGDAAVGDPDLLAGERPAAVVVARRPGADRRSVGTGAGFGEAERGDQLATGQARQVALFLFVAAEQQQALHADRAVRADGQRYRAVVAAGLAEHARVSAIGE